MIPRITIYCPADTTPARMPNRYGNKLIGYAVVLFGRCFSLQWRRP